MKGSSCLANTNRLTASLPLSNDNCPVIPCQSRFSCNVKVAKVRNLCFKVNNHSWPNHACSFVHKGKVNDEFAVGCASWSLVTELERELEAEMNSEEDKDKAATIGMARFRHKCGEGKGVVELLECLEKEAIMGEDVGKEPTDYNRRAQIFDRSSRVFQALKEQNSDVASQR